MFSIRRHLREAVLHVFILAFFLASTPSSRPGEADLVIDAYNAEEIALLEELADWIEPDADRLSVSDAIRQRRQSFEVFRRYHGGNHLIERLDEVPYGSTILQTAQRHRLDALLLASIIEVESGFDPAAVSYRGATGLMQVMPATAGSEDPTALVDPERNLDLGARYFHQLLRRYSGDLELALAAYNAGPGNVQRYGGVPPFRETRHYVEKVLEIYVGHHREIWQDSETAEQLARM